MTDEIRELPLSPDDRHSDADRQARELPVIIDPLAWTERGDDCPDAGLVLAGAGRRFRSFYLAGRDLRTWQAVCPGKNGVEARENRRFLELTGGASGTWDGSTLQVYDVIEWGWCAYSKRSANSERWFGVVIEICDDRLVLWEHRTLARAVKASWRGKVAAQANEHAIAARRRLWEEERARLAVMGPVVLPDAEDLEAIEALW